MLTKIKNCLIIASALLFIFHSSSWAEMKSTNRENVALLSGPSEKESVKWEYGKGFPVKVVAKQGKWIKVQDFENDGGWIQSSSLSNEPSVIVKVNKGKNKKINIRSGPGPKYAVVGQAYYGVVFAKNGTNKTWIKVKHESGLEGWIEESLIWGF
jgi:SH3-like domain-containing protein